MNTGKIVLGTLAGLSVGAIAGILFAPDKGSVTRKNIIDKGDDYIDGLKSKYDEITHAVSDGFSGVKADAQELMEREKTQHKDIKKT